MWLYFAITCKENELQKYMCTKAGSNKETVIFPEKIILCKKGPVWPIMQILDISHKPYSVHAKNINFV